MLPTPPKTAAESVGLCQVFQNADLSKNSRDLLMIDDDDDWWMMTGDDDDG